MDLEQLNLLTDEQKERYMKMARLFEQPGWEVLEKWAKANAEESKERGASAKSWEENRIAAGMRIVYELIAQLPEVNEREYESLAQQQAEAKSEEIYAIEQEYE